MSKKIILCATCLFGLERFVGEEIDALGYKRLETIDGRVYFEGDENAIAKANITLRCAERVLLVLNSYTADSFTSLFDGVKCIPWEDYIGKKDAFPVNGHSVKSTLFSIPDCQSIIKKAVVERLKTVYNCSWFEETGVNYRIEFFILNDKCDIMIDTSGVPLHKRGYRTQAGEAPIRETLASAMVKIARMRENVRLWDPFCGSATIPIEAALQMTNTAPGINRAFAAENYSFVNQLSFKTARDEARAAINKDTEFFAFATDIDSGVLETANENCRRAGVSKYIRVFQKDARRITKDDVRTTIVCNPPYGERLSSINEARKLYTDMGKAFSKLSPWQIYIITSEELFEKYYGRKCDKARKLYNGMIKCCYYQYYKNNSSVNFENGKRLLDKKG